MASSYYYSGDYVGAVVADLGQCTTKIGWAGDDYPKSYFRSNVAIQRQQDPNDENSNKGSKSGAAGTAAIASKSTSSSSSTRNKTQTKIRVDYMNRPLAMPPTTEEYNKDDDLDGDWQLTNPVNAATGLWYSSDSSGGMGNAGTSAAVAAAETNNSNNNSSHNSNDNENDVNNSGTGTADWYDLVQLLLQHGYTTGLGKASPKDHPLLLAEKSYNPPPIRQQLMELLFEQLEVPATFLSKDAVLQCYGCGRTTATVVDVGYGGSTVTPVYEGYVEAKAIRRSPVGCHAMDALILEQLDAMYNRRKKLSKANATGVVPLYQLNLHRQWGDPSRHRPTNFVKDYRRRPEFHTAARMYVAQECRAMGAGAAINTTNADGGTVGAAPSAAAGAAAAASGGAGGFHAPSKPFQLPDGTVLEVPSAIRFGVADLLLGNDEASMNRRRQLYETREQELNTLIAAINESEEGDNDDVKNTKKSKAKDGAEEDDGGMEIDFSEEAAVGITKRRSHHHRGSGGGNKKRKGTTTTRFNNRVLQKACSSYLQSQTDQLTSASLASMVCDAAYRCDRDQQVAMLGNVVLGGGGACLGPTEQAMPDMLRENIEGLIHQHTPGWRVKLLTPNTLAERSYLAWLGGSILASLGTFHEMWITKQEYEEYGTAIVNRKCP